MVLEYETRSGYEIGDNLLGEDFDGLLVQREVGCGQVLLEVI
jgi:hypothetical protein